MSAIQSSRPIAGLPHSYHQLQHQQHRPNGIIPQQQQHQQTPQKQLHPSVYNPPSFLLHPGPRNRLILSIRSGIPSEVDHALPRLVVASFDQSEIFKLDSWHDSVPALLDWPTRWVAELEKEAILFQLRRGTLNFEVEDKTKQTVLGVVAEWNRDSDLENRATNSLLILRNASFSNNNSSIMTRPIMIDFITRFFSLPLDFLLDLLLRIPEPIQHLLVILQSIFPHLKPFINPSILEIFGSTLPSILVETRDLSTMQLLLPLLISSYSLNQTPNTTLPPPPSSLIPYLLNLLTLTSSPANSLDLPLDLLISLTTNTINTRTILSSPEFPAHLRNLVILLEHSSDPLQATWEIPGPYQGIMVRNPASMSAQVEEAIQKRRLEREIGMRQFEQLGKVEIIAQGGTGDRPPTISPGLRKKLYAMSEPQRSIAWMHETFVYSADAHILQVSFWHAYRDFFQHPSTLEPLLSASEAIKNVNVAFPGAPAKVWVDERGEQKFILSGIGFRKGSDEDNRFLCQWSNCLTPKGYNNTAELLNHVQTSHIAPESPTICLWATCGVNSVDPNQRNTPFSLSHLFTHLPLSISPPIPDYVSSHPASANFSLSSSNITSRPPPPLPRNFKLAFTGQVTPVDQRRHPTGVGFLAALLIRNLARTLRNEIAQALPSGSGSDLDSGLSVLAQTREEKKKHLMEERFGLPIPDIVLKEEEEEEKAAGGGSGNEVEESMTREARERARIAFESVEGRILNVVECNMSGMGQYLGDAFGFGGMEWV